MSERNLGLYLTFKSKYLKDVLKGTKKATIRLGIIRPFYKKILIECGGKLYGEAVIKSLRYVELSKLSEDDAIKDGFKNLKEMMTNLKKIYPFLKEKDKMTIIEFEVTEVYSQPVPKSMLNKDQSHIAKLALAYWPHWNSKERKVLAELSVGKSIEEIAAENEVSVVEIVNLLSTASSRLRSVGLSV